MLKIKKRSIFVLIVVFAIAFLSFFTLQSREEKVKSVFAANETYEYALLLDEYEIRGDQENIEVETPNGSTAVISEGKLIFTDTGTYIVRYPDGSEIRIIVFEHVPLFEFTYSGQMQAEYRAGDTVLFPAATIKSAVETAETYSVILEQDGNIIETYENMQEEFSLQLEAAGTYVVYYCYRDVFGYLTNDSIEFKVVNQRNLIVPEIPSEWYFNTPLYLEEYYGYYNGTKYDAELTISDPDENSVLVGESFLPSKIGRYTFSFESNVDGEILNKQIEVNVVYDYSGYFTPKNDITAISPIQMPEYVVPTSSGRGVEIRADKTGAAAYYNRIIDLREYTKEDNLISFYPISDSTSKLTEIKISLVDVYDEDNVVTVQFWGSTESPNHSYVLANNGSGFYGRNNEGVNADQKLRERWGSVAHFNSFNSAAYPENIAFTVQYDWETNQILSKLYYEQQIVYDLDDDAFSGRVNDWGGFTTGEVYLRIDFSGVTLKNSGIAISEIAKTSFRKQVQTWSDDVNFLKFDFSESIEKMPVGVTGEFYPFPVPVGHDIVIGNYDFSVQLIRDPSGIKEDITSAMTNGGFTPESAGMYRLRYSAIAPFGAQVVKEIDFEIAENAVPIEIEMAQPDQTELDKYYSLPEIIATGGSGTLDLNVKTFYNGTEVMPNSAGKIFLNEPGEIVLNITVTDFLGTVAEKEFIIPVTQEEPLVRISGVPEAVAAGTTIVFPDFTAYDLTVDPEDPGYEMKRSISVNGTALDMENREYKVPEESGTLTVTYLAGEGDRQVKKEFSVFVISDPVAPQDYMIFDRSYITAETNSLETKFGAERDFDIVFPYPLVSDGLTINLDGSDAADGYIYVRLEDYENSSIAFTLTISDDGNKNSLITLNGKKSGRIPGKLGSAQNGRFVFIVDSDCYVKDSSGAKILLLDTCENGDVFTGFPSGIVRFSLGMAGVSSYTELGIVSVMGQTFNNFFIEDGDLTGPAVVFRGNSDFSEYSVNDTVIVPEAEAYDVFHPDTSVTVTVRDPDGTIVYNKVNANTELSFNVEKYGYYSIIYEAYDGLFNKTEKRFNVFVKDEIAPEVSINGDVAREIKVGSDFSVPAVVASDNVSENPIIVCFIEKPDFSRDIVEQGSKYVFTEAGSYNFVVYVRDDSYNIVRKSFAVEVKE